MASLRLEIVTAERLILTEDDVAKVTIPGADGELTILPRHASLITLLRPGELRVTRRGVEVNLAVSGGFVEVHDSHVRVLADSAERAEEIDVARAQAAEQRASALMADRSRLTDLPAAASALRRSRVRLKVARRRRGGPLAG
ncbi:MAG: F0F1 ATP synthase subunit epsilon [Chloroflexota bacterium]|nr:MAG: F0F1 ATP synthase subunit epsilon [Chloroflexota bacterium]